MVNMLNGGHWRHRPESHRAEPDLDLSRREVDAQFQSKFGGFQWGDRCAASNGLGLLAD